MNRPPAGIPTLLDPYAVEPTDLWHRTSQHVSRFPDSLSEPTRLLEYEYVGVLRHHGIRAEHATIYEDENLGIDIWVFFYIEMAARWEWLPIDLTMCALPYREQKFREARSKGVIPLLMNQSHVKNRSHKLIPVMVRGIQLHFEQFPHVELFSRFAALLRNNAAPAYRTSTSRS